MFPIFMGMNLIRSHNLQPWTHWGNRALPKKKTQNPGGSKRTAGVFYFEKQYICNKAKECEAYWCIHNRPHAERMDGEESIDFHFPLSCTELRLSDRDCRELGIHDEVKCVPAKIKAKKFPRNHEYEFCMYYEGETGECCNGVDEGTKCRGLYHEECEGYEADDWYEWTGKYIELTGKEMTETEIEQKKINDLIKALSCGCENMGWDDRRRYCDSLNFQSCHACTKSKSYITARIMEQVENKVL
jgi:hypothetical protein